METKTKEAPIYCGNGKEHKFEDGGSVVHFSLNLAKIKEHVYEFNGAKYVNLTMLKLMITSQTLQRLKKKRVTYHFNLIK